ncbi:hypothetical protein L2729_02325 [Shewanella gelidimarina]|uniref:hypothetical protein n=1 Tax=Shewanella gelidimarina TaxID=56813 RepID=UPI00200F73BB|nr:hypothetical protein [Shewanella gelidimarina]MCL1056826.1 hypothetical protein [Shewanella gelidimarina]
MSKDALPQSSQYPQTTEAKTSLPIERYDGSATLYDYLADGLESIFEQGDKLRFSKFGTQSAYLPSWATVMQLLGWTNPSLKMLSFIEGHTGVPLKVSRTARYDLFTQKGVAERAGFEVFNWMTTAADPFFKQSCSKLQLDMDRASKVGSNAGDWLSGVAGYKAKAKLEHNDDYFELVPLIKFLEKRCREDVSFLELAKKQIKQQQLDTNNPSMAWQLQLPLWNTSSLVDETILNDFSSHFKKIASKETYSNTQKLSFISCYLPIYFDFYFGAFASFEVGCVLYYRDEHESLESKKGILNRAITSYSTTPKVKSCLEALLDEIRDVIPNQERKMTWTDLAAFIPVNVDESELEYSATKLKRKKVDRLKAWRNKKDLPTNDLLRRFLGNIYESIGEQGSSALGDLFVIATGIDRQVTYLSKQAEREGISKGEIESEVRAVLTTYNKYYQHSLKQYL